MFTCDDCGKSTEEAGSKWYPAHKEVLYKIYRHACKECVREFAVKNAIRKQREKKLKVLRNEYESGRLKP